MLTHIQGVNADGAYQCTSCGFLFAATQSDRLHSNVFRKTVKISGNPENMTRGTVGENLRGAVSERDSVATVMKPRHQDTGLLGDTRAISQGSTRGMTRPTQQPCHHSQTHTQQPCHHSQTPHTAALPSLTDSTHSSPAITHRPHTQQPCHHSERRRLMPRTHVSTD